MGKRIDDARDGETAVQRSFTDCCRVPKVRSLKYPDLEANIALFKVESILQKIMTAFGV